MVSVDLAINKSLLKKKPNPSPRVLLNPSILPQYPKCPAKLQPPNPPSLVVPHASKTSPSLIFPRKPPQSPELRRERPRLPRRVRKAPTANPPLRNPSLEAKNVQQRRLMDLKKGLRTLPLRRCVSGSDVDVFVTPPGFVCSSASRGCFVEHFYFNRLNPHRRPSRLPSPRLKLRRNPLQKRRLNRRQRPGSRHPRCVIPSANFLLRVDARCQNRSNNVGFDDERQSVHFYFFHPCFLNCHVFRTNWHIFYEYRLEMLLVPMRIPLTSVKPSSKKTRRAVPRSVFDVYFIMRGYNLTFSRQT